MKKKILKGFTLIELIVVMAIFSILMAGALALVDPVSRINKSASDFEKTSAYVDNIQDYLQDSLRYAENVWVYQGNYDNAFLLDEVKKFKDTYYKDTVYTKDGVHTVYTKGNIRMMTILNQDVMGVDSSGNPVVASDSFGTSMCEGQILMNKVPYRANQDISSIGSSETQLNPDFFNKDFSFKYILGASQLENSGHDTAQVKDISKGKSMNFENFAVGVVTYDNEEYTKMTSPAAGEYPFTCQYSVATIPLINIINRGQPKQYYIYETDSMGNIDTSRIKLQSISFPSFYADSANITADPDDNIYIIYSLSDEVNLPQ